MGLNNCRISHALRSNSVIYKDLITEFWKNALINKLGEDEVDVVKSMVKGTQIIVYEQVIREVLEFGDAPTFPVEFSAHQVREALEKMCYEGTYPLPSRSCCHLSGGFWHTTL